MNKRKLFKEVTAALLAMMIMLSPMAENRQIFAESQKSTSAVSSSIEADVKTGKQVREGKNTGRSEYVHSEKENGRSDHKNGEKKTKDNDSEHKENDSENKREYVEKQGSYAESQGGYAESQGGNIETQRDYTENQENYTEKQRDDIENQDDYVKNQGKRTEKKDSYVGNQGESSEDRGERSDDKKDHTDKKDGEKSNTEEETDHTGEMPEGEDEHPDIDVMLTAAQHTSAIRFRKAFGPTIGNNCKYPADRDFYTKDYRDDFGRVFCIDPFANLALNTPAQVIDLRNRDGLLNLSHEGIVNGYGDAAHRRVWLFNSDQILKWGIVKYTIEHSGLNESQETALFCAFIKHETLEGPMNSPIDWWWYTSEVGLTQAMANDIINRGISAWMNPETKRAYYLTKAYILELGGKNQRMLGIKAEKLEKGSISLQKVSAEPEGTEGNPAYSLEGAKYGIWKDAACSGSPQHTIGTDARGKTKEIRLTAGQYYVKEIQASKGYVLDRQIYPITVHAGENVIKEVQEVPIKGGIKVQKADRETKEKKPQGDATLQGADFVIINRNDYPVSIGGKHYKKGEVAARIKTNEQGIATTGNRDLPCGKYEISEAEPSTGYLLNDSWKESFIIQKDGEVIDLTTKVVDEPVIHGDVRIQKKDLEMSRLTPEDTGADPKADVLGDADLSGIRFIIRNASKNAVRINGKSYKKDEAVGSITTDSEGIAKTEGKFLPYGSYTLQEMPEEEGSRFANESYLLSDQKTHPFQIRRDGEVVTADPDGKVLESLDQVKRNDLSFRKYEEESGEPVQMTPFVITMKKTGEKHVIVTDKQGEWDSKRYAHSKNTNAMDHLLSKYKEDDRIPANELDDRFGTWFGQGQKGARTETDDDLPAFPYGEYLLTELPCENNGGLQLIKDFPIEINKDASEVKGGRIDLSDLCDELEQPEIRTEAYGKETSEKLLLAGPKAEITDKVSINGISKGSKYLLRATLMDKEKKQTIRARDDEGKMHKVTAELPFTGTGEKMELEVPIKLDASELAGKTVVVFEKLYTLREDRRVLIAEHADYKDKSQSIYIPAIYTTAKNKDTGDHTGSFKENRTICDEVLYKNLIPEKEYTIKGQLMDKDTGDPIKGTEQELVFMAEHPNGRMTLEFVLDRAFGEQESKEKTVVAFETIYYNKKEVASHKDINDEAQSVTFLKPSEDLRKGGISGTTAASHPPTTGDSIPIGGLVVLLFLTSAGMILLIFLERRNRKKNRSS